MPTLQTDNPSLFLPPPPPCSSSSSSPLDPALHLQLSFGSCQTGVTLILESERNLELLSKKYNQQGHTILF